MEESFFVLMDFTGGSSPEITSEACFTCTRNTFTYIRIRNFIKILFKLLFKFFYLFAILTARYR